MVEIWKNLLLLCLAWCSFFPWALGYAATFRNFVHLQTKITNRAKCPALKRNSDDAQSIEKSLPLKVFRDQRDRGRCLDQLFEIESEPILQELNASKKGNSIGAGIVPICLNTTREVPLGARIANTVLFERCFYPDLLNEVALPCPGIILVGSAGTSKSIFQYVLLRHLIANPDALVCGVKPEVIIRQDGDRLFVYDMTHHKVFKGPVSSDILDAFNPANTVFFYEPGHLKQEPFKSQLKTLITVSPDSSRFKEFAKSIDENFLYMPSYCLVELLAIGEFIRNELILKCATAEEIELFSPDAIKRRYREYGGIFRRVLPPSHAAAANNERAKNRAISGLDIRSIKREFALASDISPAGSYFVHLTATKIGKDLDNSGIDRGVRQEDSEFYDPTMTKWNFKCCAAHFASQEAIDITKSLARDLAYSELKDFLVGLNQSSPESPLIAPVFEEFAVLAVKRVRKLVKMVWGQPKHAEMEPNVLYLPRDGPSVVHAYYQDRRGLLHFVHVNSFSKPEECCNGAIADLLRKLDFTPHAKGKIEIIYCRLNRGSEWKLNPLTCDRQISKQSQALDKIAELKNEFVVQNYFHVTNFDFSDSMEPIATNDS